MVLFVHQFYQLTQNPSIIDQKFENHFRGILLISLTTIKGKKVESYRNDLNKSEKRQREYLESRHTTIR